MYYTKNTFWIEVESGQVDRIPWEGASGGVKTEDGFTDLIVQRVRSDDNVKLMVGYGERVGAKAQVLIQHMAHGRLGRKGILYRGKVVALEPSECSANSNDVAMDRLVISPTSLVPVG